MSGCISFLGVVENIFPCKYHRAIAQRVIGERGGCLLVLDTQRANLALARRKTQEVDKSMDF